MNKRLFKRYCTGLDTLDTSVRAVFVERAGEAIEGLLKVARRKVPVEHSQIKVMKTIL
jgi:hypothetical protein